jgi:hypothetical protein
MKNKTYIFLVLCIVSFIVLAFAYFTPVLSGKGLIQPDIVNYRGGAEELTQYRKTFEEDAYWTNSMFSGMPTYQAGAQYPMDFLKKIDAALRLYLPRPVDYIFLFMSGFFLLGMVWTKNWKYALLGATMFGFSSYFFIILEAGHNGKAHAIAYFAPLFAGIYLLFKRNYFWGFILTTLFFALELMANHIQMTYYLFFAIGIFILTQLYFSIKDKQLKAFGISLGLFVTSSLFAVGMNSTRLLATYEYGKETTRGKSELVKKNNEKPSEGLEKDYITAWSYGKLETLNLFIPNFMGGSSSDETFESKKLQEAIQNHISSEEQYQKISKYLSGSPYWGEQPGTSPAYQGAIVCFLAILGLFFIPLKHRIWIIGSLAISMMLAWGKNFMFLTDVFIDYVPMYNKFRAVSSFMVVPEFLLPLTAMIGIYYYFTDKNLGSIYKRQILTYVGGGILALLIIFYLFGSYLFAFANETELANLPEVILDAVKEDRIPLFKSDVLRTFIFCGITLLLLFFYENKKIKLDYVLYVLIILSITDLWTVNKRFLNDENFVASKYEKNPFPTDMSESMISDAEKNPALGRIVYFSAMNNVLNEIKTRDTTNYRVFNTAYDPWNENNTSYFHNSIGGYHAAKLLRYQELINEFFNLSEGKINMEVMNMLNVKYVLLGEISKPEVAPNINANGNAWLVSKIKNANNANEEIEKLRNTDTKKEVVIRSDVELKSTSYSSDTLGFIKLKKYLPNHLTYQSQSKTKQFGVFSEIYYPHGWNAFIDGVEVPHFRVNYVLRGLEVPAGVHKIEFKFQPKVIETGKIMTLISFVLFIIGITVWFFYKRRKRIA